MYYYMYFIRAKSIHYLLIKCYPNIFISSYMFVLLSKLFTVMNIASLDICSIYLIQLLDNLFKLNNILLSSTRYCYLIINYCILSSLPSLVSLLVWRTSPVAARTISSLQRNYWTESSKRERMVVTSQRSVPVCSRTAAARFIIASLQATQRNVDERCDGVREDQP